MWSMGKQWAYTEFGKEKNNICNIWVDNYFPNNRLNSGKHYWWHEGGLRVARVKWEISKDLKKNS